MWSRPIANPVPPQLFPIDCYIVGACPGAERQFCQDISARDGRRFRIRARQQLIVER